MAVVIEPGIVGSDNVRRVAELIQLDEDAVMGKLVRLWESSQRLKKTEASVTEIGFWLRAGPHAQQWVEAFADELAGFLEHCDGPDGYFRIRGNSHHIEKVTAMRDANQARARARWEKQRSRHTDGIPPAEPPNTDGVSVECLNQAVLNQAKPSQAKPSEPPKAPLRGADSLPLGLLVKAALEEYKQTLLHFGVQRGVGQREYDAIARALSRYRDNPEIVTLAIVGARKQTKDKNYDPSKFVSLSLYLRDDKIEHFANLGSGKTDADGIDWSTICQR